MKQRVMITVTMVALCAVAAPSLADGKKGQKIDAAAEFKKHCAVCHPDGGNIINKNKPIGKKALEANGIKSDKEIVAKMRKPGPGMTAFDAKTISDREAKAIADYILKTFK